MQPLLNGLELATAALQLAALLLNGSVLHGLFCVGRRCSSSRFLLSLALSHCSVSAVALLHFVARSLPSPLVSSTAWTQCISLLNSINTYAILTASLATSLTVALISVERCVTITRPMSYKHWLSSGRYGWAVAGVWLISIGGVMVGPVVVSGVDFGGDEARLPTGQLALYYAVLLSAVTVLVLVTMTACYGVIFRIARSKCRRRVQIGQLAPPAVEAAVKAKPRGSVSSISSDWPSSYSYSGQSDALLAGVYNPCMSVAIVLYDQEAGKQNSDLGRQLQSAAARHSTSHASVTRGDRLSLPITSPRLQQSNFLKRRSWTARRPSPSKTVTTILLLVGCLVISHIPLCAGLFLTAYAPNALLQACVWLLVTTSSVSTPVLYGFRGVRAGLAFRRARGRQVVSRAHESKAIGTKDVPKPACGTAPVPLSNLQSLIEPKPMVSITITLDDGVPEPTPFHEELDLDLDEEELLTVCPKRLPRKTSQDSGADMRFSDDDDCELDEEEEVQKRKDEEVCGKEEGRTTDHVVTVTCLPQS